MRVSGTAGLVARQEVIARHRLDDVTERLSRSWHIESFELSTELIKITDHSGTGLTDMTAEALNTSWRQDLPEYMTVSVDGVFAGVDPEITDRLPGRIVLTMPDFTADNLARVLAKAWQVARAMDDPSIGPAERALAEGLAAAAQAGGYHCALGGLSLPPGEKAP